MSEKEKKNKKLKSEKGGKAAENSGREREKKTAKFQTDKKIKNRVKEKTKDKKSEKTEYLRERKQKEIPAEAVWERNTEEPLTFRQIHKNEEVNVLIERGNEVLGALGYTEHSVAHAVKTANTAGMILSKLGYSEREAELSRIAGFMHDIGNSVNRHDHAHTGAILAWQILREEGMSLKEAAVIASAIGNHDEETGTAVDPISAALILADKTDVRRNRVRNRIKATFDAHDRVNYAVLSSRLEIQKEKKVIQMEMELDDSMCSVMDYFEIFLQRMLMCRRAAEVLGCRFKLIANGSKVC